MVVTEKIKVELDTAQAKKAATDVEKRLGTMFDKTALKAAAFNQAMVLGTKALGVMVDGLKEGARAALEYERTTAQLRTTLASLGDTGGRWVETLQHQSGEIERLSGVSDETIRKFQIMALNAGVSTDQLDGLLKASLRLSNAFGMDLQTALVQIIKTKTGVVEETLKMTGALEGVTKEQLKAGEAADVLNEKLKDQLDVMTEGTAGAAMGLNTAWANLNESFVMMAQNAGAATVMNKMADGIARFARGLSQLDGSDALKLLVPIWGAQLVAGKALQEGGALPLPGDPGAAVGGAGAGTVNLFKQAGFTPRGTRPRRRGRGGGGVQTYVAGGGGEQGVDFSGLTGARFGAAGHASDVADAQIAIEQNKADRIREINAKMAEDLNDAIAKDGAERLANHERWANAASNVFMGMADTALGALEDWASGQEVALGEIAKGFLRSTGRQLIGQGTMDVFKGLSRGLSSYGFDPTASSLIALGAAEIGAGGAMFAGSLALPPSESAGAGGGGGGGGSAGGTSFAGGAVGGSSGGGGGGGDKVVNITVNGAVTAAEVGVQIDRSLREARSKGYI